MSLLKKHILNQLASQLISQDEAKDLLLELSEKEKASEKPKSHEIAIVGMSGRFPRANNTEEFWQNLAQGINCIDDFPTKRCEDFEPILRNPFYTEFLTGDSINLEHIKDVQSKAGYLNQIDLFDAEFFGIPPSEATYMDPHQRVALENAWQTMENAGYGGDKLVGSKTGVFIGKEGTNYSLYRYCSSQDPMQLTGSWESIMVSRINYLFNFRGPCMIIDTACSAGLVSVHMAAQSILNGECEQAIAGGINLSITGEFDSKYLGGMNMDSVESDEKTVRTFDAAANGTVWGEGIGFVMLKPLAKAIADGDVIHAVIKGSAINNDGASNGLTAPNADAQEEVVVEAWEKAGINPETLSYIEAHGTGTVLGDPIEFKGLTNAFRRYTKKRQFCAIGSLKTNMGHLVGASGCASLFKVIKSIQSKSIAPTINFNSPNPYINFLSSPLYVSDRLQQWKEGDFPRRAALSSFGFSHTNCHMVIEEAPQREVGVAKRPAYCFTLSAKKQHLLLDYLDRYKRYSADSNWNIADLCFTANNGRGHYPYRLAIVTSSETEFKQQLEVAYQQLLSSQGESFSKQTIFYAHHSVVSDKKKQRATGEITAKQQKEISQKAQALLEKYLESSDIEPICQLAQEYVTGAQVQWGQFYLDEKRCRLPLPTYPFEEKRYWAAPKISQVSSFNNSIHPLLDRRVLDTQASNLEKKWIYESEFSNETHWILTDHKIKNTGVVPGTTYLEMVRAAIADALTWQSLELKDLFFLQPMVVEDSTQRTIRVVLLQGEAETISFLIESIQSHSSETDWVKHVEGNAHLIEPSASKLNVDELKQHATDFIEKYEGESDTGVFQFGPHWDTVRSIWSIQQGPQTAAPDNEGRDEEDTLKHTLASLSLPLELQTELTDFLIHPSVLDNAMNVTSQDTGETYLPFMYKSFKYYRPFTPNMMTLIKPKSETSSQHETHNYDVVLTDEVGNVIAEASNYITKKVNNFDFNVDAHVNDYLELAWMPKTQETAANLPQGKLLVLCPSGKNSGKNSAQDSDFIKESLKAFDLKLVDFPSFGTSDKLEQYINQLISDDDLMQDVTGLIMLNSLTGGLAKNYFLNTEMLDEQCLAGLYAQFYLSKALIEFKRPLEWGIASISKNAYAVSGTESFCHPVAAATHTFALSAAMENASVSCRVLDIEEGTSGEQIEQCLMTAEKGKIYALRGEISYQQQLRPRILNTDDTDTKQVGFKDEGVYLITGGLGGLGLAAAKFIGENTKNAHVILLGRSTLADESQWSELATSDNSKQARTYTQLLDLKESLASIDYFVVDVSNEVQVNDLASVLQQRSSKVSGVLHTAGIAGDGFIMNKQAATFANVLQAKVAGTCNLMRVFEDKSLDFFLCYSSITALTGGEGQADYAAANAFMDALVPAFANSSVNFISINWPSWNDVGMALDYQVDDEQTPFISLSSDQALSKLTQIFSQGIKQVLPSDINRKLFSEFKDLLPFTLSPELESVTQDRNARSEAVVDTDIEIFINGKSEEDLSKVEVKLAKIYAAVLGLQEVDVFTSFQDMGGNSIIATHLLKVVEQHFDDLIDISDIFSYPSIDEMAEYIQSKLLDEETSSEEQNQAKQKADINQGEVDEEDWNSVLEQALGDDAAIDSLLDRL
jgi:polyketide synthase PksN